MSKPHRSRSSYRGLSPSQHDNQSYNLDILETRVMTLNEFLELEDQMAFGQVKTTPTRPIPALLLPGESMQHYEHRFSSWLLRRNVTIESLRNIPEVERRFRLDFADSRAWELRRERVRLQQGLTTSSLHDEGRKLKSQNNQRIRSRSELLATEAMTAKQFVQGNEDVGLNGRMMTGEKLRPIAVVLNHGETVARYELNLQRWLATKNVKLAVLESDPEEERRYRQCFAYARASSHMHYDNRWAPHTKTTAEKRSASQEPDHWDRQQEKRQRLSTEIDKAYSPFPDPATLNDCGVGKDSGTGHEHDSSRIFDGANEILAKVEQVHECAISKALFKDYTRMSDQIEVNELAMNDALAFVKISTNIDKAEATEHLRQIRELAMMINEEKRRRNSVLAAAMSKEWEGRQRELEQFLELSSETGTLNSSHQNLAIILKKLECNLKKMQGMQVKLANRLKHLSPENTKQNAQFEEVAVLSSNLRAALSERSWLNDQHKIMSVDLLRSNEEVRMLTIELVEEAAHVWNEQ